ncbi:hypothetical protein GCM10026983_15840 [Gracilibacillus alcaliphilus]
MLTPFSLVYSLAEKTHDFSRADESAFVLLIFGGSGKQLSFCHLDGEKSLPFSPMFGIIKIGTYILFKEG